MRKALEFGYPADAVSGAHRGSFLGGCLRLACAGMALIALGRVTLPLHAQSASESEVKAAFLYNFTKFIEWPSDPQRPASGGFMFCFAGNDTVGWALHRSVAGKSVNGRLAAVRRVARAAELRGCNVVFVGRSEARHLLRSLPPEEYVGILTVGEEEQFLDKGGMITLIEVDNRIRFEINLDAVDRAGLHISSKLLNLAKLVQPKRNEERR